MGSDTQSVPVSKKALWTGRILSALPVLMLLMSAIMKLLKPAQVVEGFTKLGYPESLALGIGLLEIACTIVYLIPRTSILGAVLLTGYLGGATATHVRVGEPSLMPVVLGMLVWGGLYLRDRRLRALLPLRSDPACENTSNGRRTSLVKKILIGFAALAIVFAFFIILQPNEFRVTRSTAISASPAEVFAQVNDFHNWEAWSPWAKLDPEAKLAFDGPSSGTGAIFSWSGNDKIGEGRMTVLESHPHDWIEIKLDFKKPFESTCVTEYTFKPEGEQTVITWSMHGEKDILSRVFCLFMDMDKMIGGDFEKGLAQMKTVAETKARK